MPPVVVVERGADNGTTTAMAAVAAFLTGRLSAECEAEGACLVRVIEAPPTTAAVGERVRELARSADPAPAVVLVALSPPAYSRAEALEAGADELVQWPEESAELAAKVASLVRLRRRDLDTHPLTGLPGGAALHRAIERRMANRDEPLGVVAFDLRHFKAFNDRYGFARGDAVLRMLADVLKTVALDGEMVYHIGGDDFCVLTHPDRLDALGRGVVAEFEGRMSSYYDPEDLERGVLPGLSRATGEMVTFPLVGLIAVAADTSSADMTHPGRLAQVLAELRAHAKGMAGSTYLRDRRTTHEVAESLRECSLLKRRESS